jgi:hypothetical protein
MKRTALALALILALLFSAVALTQMAMFAEANPNMFPIPYEHISINSPQDKVYHDTDTILLNFTVKSNYEQEAIFSYFYLLDAQKDYRLESVKVEEINEFMSGEEYCYEGQAILSNLTIGSHKLTVFQGYVDSDGTLNGRINFDPSASIVYFSIEPEPFPTTLVATASGISVAVVSLGLLVYLKKRKH